MTDETEFLGNLRDFLEAADRRPLAPGAESRVLAAVRGGGRPRSLPRLGWNPGRPLRTALAVALVGLVGTGAAAYLNRGTRLDHAALVVAVQPAGRDQECRLPISALSDDRTTGFINLRPGGAAFEPVSTAGTTYVPALHQWAKTLPQMVAPDGRSYVYDDTSPQRSILHIVDAHGDRALGQTPPFVSAFAFTPDGILLLDSSGNSAGPQPNGRMVFRMMDPQTGAIRDLPIPPLVVPVLRMAGASAETGYVRSGNGVWTTIYSAGTNISVLSRYDLATGASAEWYNGASDGTGDLHVIGADAMGRPIVQVSSTDLFHTNPGARNGIHQATELLAAPHRATVLNDGVVGRPGSAGNLSPLSVTDADRTWMASDDGQVWLYRGGQMRLMAKVTTSTRGAPGVAISGPCQ